MSKKLITARMRPDGTVIEVLENGEERPFPETPMPPMTEEEIHAAAMADPDARPMTPEELQRARFIPRTKQALGSDPFAGWKPALQADINQPGKVPSALPPTKHTPEENTNHQSLLQNVAKTRGAKQIPPFFKGGQGGFAFSASA